MALCQKRAGAFRRLAGWLAAAFLAAALAGTASSFGVAQEAPSGPADSAEGEPPFGELFSIVWGVIEQEFAGVPRVNWGEVGARYFRRVAYAPSEEEAYEGLVEMVELLGDPGTFVRTPAEVKARAAQDPGSSFSGVGLVIGTMPSEEIVVISVLERGPAHRAGVVKGERITAIDGEPTAGMSAVEAAQRIRGERGTRVHLTLLAPHGAERTLAITRGPVQFEPKVSSRVLDGNIGYIALPSFRSGMDADFLTHLRRMYRTRALIIDLRNGDGTVSPAVVLRIAGLLTGDPLGALVTRRGSFAIEPDRAWQGGTGRFGVPGPTRLDYWEKPVALLVDDSVHASLFSLAFVHGLQESGRATVVGRSSGVGGVGYSEIDLPGGGALSLAVGYLVSLKEPRFVQVLEPDISVPMDRQYLESWYRGGDLDIERAREALLAQL